MALRVLVWVNSALLLTASQTNGQTVQVQTDLGEIRGSVVSLSDEVGFSLDIQQYLGIPFAKPPIGSLRFSPPEPVDPWTEVYEANALPNACYQVAVTPGILPNLIADLGVNAPLSEDCLYLNVWTPNPRPQNAAVLVWIYGGGYTIGSSATQLYDGKILSGFNNVIVVSMNYRVDSLGFLSLGVGGAMGNAGLLDQQLAIKWVSDNIAAFGGDPDKVTIFGESAGGGSVSFHLLARDSRMYFKRAIMQSGVADAPWSVKSQAERQQSGLKLGEVLGCPHDTAHKDRTLECLRGLDPGDIINHNHTDLQFGPVDNDGIFITQAVKDILSSEYFYKTEIMLGANTNEGSLFLPFVLPDAINNDFEVSLNETMFKKSIITLLVINGLQSYVENEAVHEATIFQYTNWLHPNLQIELAHGLDQILGDNWFVCPTSRFAQVYTNANQTTFTYFFAHRSSTTYFPEWAGVAHGDDIPFVFGVPLNLSTGYTAQEIEFSKTVMKFWINFARSGDPNVDENGVSNVAARWPERTVDGMEYLTLTANPSEMSVGAGPRETYCVFWEEYLPKLADVTTYSCPDTGNKATEVSGNIWLMWGLLMVSIGMLQKYYSSN